MLKIMEKKSEIVNDMILQAEQLGTFFDNWEEFLLKLIKNLALNKRKNLKIGCAAVSKNAQAASASIKDVIIFHQTPKGFYFGKSVSITYKNNFF